ncbi:hypothetical protein KY347_06985 [Candidatus Woesearchaeota archaeon]|nr:hypothetical protein [Candidatus Woesearchaeota archaeon]
MAIKIPKGKDLIGTFEPECLQIRAPNGEMLNIRVPQTEKEVEKAWEVVEGYTSILTN